eukprot:6204197-Pleurochrysis_carterae.AAC.7
MESGSLHYNSASKIEGPEEACQAVDVNVTFCAQDTASDGTMLECSLAVKAVLTGAEEESLSCRKVIALQMMEPASPTARILRSRLVLESGLT